MIYNYSCIIYIYKCTYNLHRTLYNVSQYNIPIEQRRTGLYTMLFSDYDGQR